MDAPEWWTRAIVAAHLGIAEQSVRGQMSRWKIPTRYEIVNGRTTAHYDGAAILKAQARRPGRGVGGGRPRKLP